MRTNKIADDLCLEADSFPVMRRRKTFACPHCGEMCSLPVAIQVLEPEKFVDDEHTRVAVADPLSGLSEDQRRMVEAAESGGILGAFKQACDRRTGNQEMKPVRIGAFFVTFLRMARPKQVPTFVLQHYREAFNGYLEFWGSQGVLAVTAGGRIRAFLPLNLAIGMKIKPAAGGRVHSRNLSARISADEDEFSEWVKTRNGYVPVQCQLFLKEMQKRSVGEFADVRM